MQRVIVIILAVLVSLPAILKSRGDGSISVPAAFPVSASGKTVVRVSGDVRHAGIYEVGANFLTIDVIKLATADSPVKRLVPDAALSGTVVNGADINLKLLSGGSGMVTVRSMGSGERMVLGVPLDINSMSAADFDRLPGVGPVMAGRIIEFRQNNGGKLRVEDLLAIEGIGETKYKKLCIYF